MIQDILNQTREKMIKALEIIREDLSVVEIGRARPALVEKIQVAAYEGSFLTIRELANITAPDPQQIIISPWDKSILAKISQAIQQSDLKLTPVVDGEVIRLSIPALTQERLEEVKKLIEVKLESGRKILRGVRNEAKSAIDDLKDEPGVSEDDIYRGREELQKLSDEFVEKVETLGELKIKALKIH